MGYITYKEPSLTLNGSTNADLRPLSSRSHSEDAERWDHFGNLVGSVDDFSGEGRTPTHNLASLIRTTGFEYLCLIRKELVDPNCFHHSVVVEHVLFELDDSCS